MEIGCKIRAIRERRRYTQEYVAGELGISKLWYGKMENDEQEIKDQYLEKLSHLYQMSVDEIRNFDEKNIYDLTITNLFSSTKELLSDMKGAYEKAFTAMDETIEVQKQMIDLLKNKLK